MIQTQHEATPRPSANTSDVYKIHQSLPTHPMSLHLSLVQSRRCLSTSPLPNHDGVSPPLPSPVTTVSLNLSLDGVSPPLPCPRVCFGCTPEMNPTKTMSLHLFMTSNTPVFLHLPCPARPHNPSTRRIAHQPNRIAR